MVGRLVEVLFIGGGKEKVLDLSKPRM